MAPGLSVHDTPGRVETPAGVSSDPRRDGIRRERYSLRASLWKVSGLPSVKGCARNVIQSAGHVEIRRTSEGASYAGLMTCSSLWACPVCSARIRHGRTLDIEAAGLRWLRGGNGLSFLTLTTEHKASDPLAMTLDAVLTAWRKVQQSAYWRRLRASGVVSGQIRATEVTYTARKDGGSGWHPHLHVLLFSSVPITPAERAVIEGRVFDLWSRAIQSMPRADGGAYGAPLRFDRKGDAVGVRLQAVEGVEGAAGLLRYLSKVQDGLGDKWSVGTEMARGDLKTGRAAASRTPFDLLRAAVDGDGVALVLWHEYEQATRGRRAIEWSRGLRAALLEDEEIADELLPEVVSDETPELVAVITPQNWRLVCRVPRLCVLLLELAEQERYGDLHRLLADACT